MQKPSNTMVAVSVKILSKKKDNEVSNFLNHKNGRIISYQKGMGQIVYNKGLGCMTIQGLEQRVRLGIRFRG